MIIFCFLCQWHLIQLTFIWFIHVLVKVKLYPVHSLRIVGLCVAPNCLRWIVVIDILSNLKQFEWKFLCVSSDKNTSHGLFKVSILQKKKGNKIVNFTKLFSFFNANAVREKKNNSANCSYEKIQRHWACALLIFWIPFDVWNASVTKVHINKWMKLLMSHLFYLVLRIYSSLMSCTWY